MDIQLRHPLLIIQFQTILLFTFGCNFATILEPFHPPVEPTSYIVYLPLVTSTTSSIWWKPGVQLTWQWQLDGNLNTSFEVDVYDIDLFDNDANAMSSLHTAGRKIICYINVGSWEDWRPDANLFPTEVLGNNYEGWPGEKWLDIRRIDLLAPILRDRFDLCKSKGFDAIEPDNIDGYANKTGFPLTYQDQLHFNIWLANEAHTRGLGIGLKNDDTQVDDLLSYFDWALTEDCYDQGWCDKMSPFIVAGKPVFMAEYTDTGVTLSEFCPLAATLQFNPVLKNRILDAWRETCP
jgi:hypothetical protein